jgi:aubergine-like protein
LGFCASLDPNLSEFYFDHSYQGTGKEIMVKIPTMVRAALDTYKERNGEYPEQIIFYRDGVGMGQLELVKEHEIKPIKEVLKQVSFALKEEIKFAEVIVTKRRSEKFYT